MQFAARLVALSAAISQALALVSLTNPSWDVTEGTAFDITWTDANGPVTLLLKDGPSSNLATVATIASGLTGTSFSWTPSGIPSGTYAVQISDSKDTNYGSQFSYAGTGTATTSATTATTASTTTTDSTSTTDSSTTTDSTSTTSASSTLTTSTVSGTSNGTSTASSTKSTSTKSSGTTGTSSSTTSTSTPLDTNASQKMGSPLALVLLTVAAVVLCH